MLKWFFLRDDCDILRNLFLEHHMLPNEGSIHSNNSRRMNAAAACVLSPLFPVLSSNSVTKSFISDFRVTMSYLARHRGGPDICHYVFCRQIVYLHIFDMFCRQIVYLHILRSHVVDLCLEFPPRGSMKGISGNDVSYRGTFLLQRYFSVTEVFSRI